MKKITLLTICTLILTFSCAKKNEPEPNTNNNTPINEKKAKACISMSNEKPEVNQNVKFDAFCSENAEFYYWYVDGQAVPSDSYREIELNRTFSTGNHSVTLRVNGEHGKDSTTTNFEVVYTPPPGPTACFTTYPNNPNLSFPVNTEIEFNGGCSKDFASHTARYQFGPKEEDRVEGIVVKKTFTSIGSYTVTFTVSKPIFYSPYLLEDQMEKTIVIY